METLKYFICSCLAVGLYIFLSNVSFKRNGLANSELSIEELKALSLNEWVWIEVLEPFGYSEKISSYYRKHEDYTHDRAFCCGYPGLSFCFDYADYNKTWIAYHHKSDE